MAKTVAWKSSIVLILGNRAERDDSLFSAQQAQVYLAEIAVPLLVIRTGKVLIARGETITA